MSFLVPPSAIQNSRYRRGLEEIKDPKNDEGMLPLASAIYTMDKIQIYEFDALFRIVVLHKMSTPSFLTNEQEYRWKKRIMIQFES